MVRHDRVDECRRLKLCLLRPPETYEDWIPFVPCLSTCALYPSPSFLNTINPSICPQVTQLIIQRACIMKDHRIFDFISQEAFYCTTLSVMHVFPTYTRYQPMHYCLRLITSKPYSYMSLTLLWMLESAMLNLKKHFQYLSDPMLRAYG